MECSKFLKMGIVGTLSLSVAMWLSSCVGTKGFRDAKWGMDQEDVKRIEENQLIDSSLKEGVLRQIFETQDIDSFLLYEGDVGGFRCTIAYGFCEKGQLIEGGYLFTENTDDYSKGWDTAQKKHKRIKELLCEKYGPALSGQIGSKTVWQDRSTYIILNMDKESQDNGILLSVLYFSFR